MADETIVLSVIDKIAPTIKVKFESIASSAERAEAAVGKFTFKLSSISGYSTQIRQLDMAAVRLSKTLESLQVYTVRAATASAKLAASDSKAATAAAKLANAEASLASTLAKRAVAESRAAVAANKLAVSQYAVVKASSDATAAQHRAALAAKRLSESQELASVKSTTLSSKLWEVGKSIASFMLMAQAGNQFVELADSYQVYVNKLTVTTGSIELAKSRLEDVANIAKKTRTPLDATTQAFSRFALAMKANGRSQEEAARFTETTNKLLVTSGATAGETGSALLQFSQALNKGKLDGDEFRTAMELMPTAMDAIAKRMGVTRSELIKLAPEGKITSEIMIQAFADIADEADAKFGMMNITIAGALTNMSTSFQMVIGKFLDSTGAATGTAKALSFIADNLETIIKVLASALLAWGAYTLAMAAASVGIYGVLAPIALLELAMIKLNAVLALNPWAAMAAALAVIVINYKEIIDLAGKAAAAVDNFFGITGRHGITSNEELLARFKQDPSSLDAKQQLDAQYLLDQDSALASTEEAKRKYAARMKIVDDLRASDVNALKSYEQHIQSLRDGYEQVGSFQESDAYRAQYQRESAAAARRQGKVMSLNDLDATIKEDSKGGKAEESRAAALAKVNLQLDNELSRMLLLAESREEQSRLDQIEETLSSKKVKMTQEESNAIRDKVKAISHASRVQSQYDVIFASHTQVHRDYLASMDAARLLSEQGSITDEQYLQTMRKLGTEYEQATDHLYEFNRQLDTQISLSSLYSREREIEAAILEQVNAAKNRGIELSLSEQAAMRQKLTYARALNEERAAEEKFLNAGNNREFSLDAQALAKVRGQIPNQDSTQVQGMLGDTAGYATESYFEANIERTQAMYEQIDILRSNDLISEQEASAAKIKMAAAESRVRMDVATSFFDNFTGLQRSENREIAAIGKAAAISNAIINTYSAANAAYASMAGIPIVGPALGVAAAAGAIASGMVNVAAIESQSVGFREGGYTGNVGKNEVAGVVHGQEYVLDADTTARLGRHNLDSLSEGGGVGGGSTELTLNVAVVASKEAGESFLAGTQGDKVLVDAVGRNSKTIKRILGAA